ncbi:MAG: hypothetical protein U5R31_08495 [Acidimicrobiia bacterium]|nr:hypothetical protein [Acidimicrobiia bacterium]
MTAMMQMAVRARMTDMPPMPLVLGSMMSGDRKTATTIGSLLHFLMMGTVVFGIVYGSLFTAFDDDSWWVGLLIGVVHALIAGLMFMPMMPRMHPRMSVRLIGAGTPDDGRTVSVDDRGEVTVAAPGVLGRNWGAMTPAGFVMGHAVYGLVLALVYGAVA